MPLGPLISSCEAPGNDDYQKKDGPSSPSLLSPPPVVEKEQAQGNDNLVAIDQQQAKTSSVADPNKNPSLRQVVGSSMEGFSKLVNENLIAARYGASATIFLLTAYGLSNTPLFFRFRIVSEIPAQYFLRRRKLYGRIVGVQVNKQAEGHLGALHHHHGSGGGDSGRPVSIQLTVRHLSPVGQILPKTWFDFFLSLSPLAVRLARARSNEHPEQIKTELLQVQLAGVQLPPVLRQHYRPEQWLERLAKQRVLVSCQLLARQVQIVDSRPDGATFSDPLINARKRKLLADKISSGGMDYSPTTELQNDATSSGGQTTDLEQIAVCRITYRPSWFQLFSTDIAESLIRTGNANVSPLVTSATIDGDGSTTTTGAKLRPSNQRRKVVDSSQRIQDLRKDVKYLDWLAKAEFQAANESMGMWSVPEVRASKAEIIEEVEFQTKANPLQKLWRWLRGG